MYDLLIREAVIYDGSDEIQVPVARAAELNDPTGCGDAYRAGLLFGLMNDMDWATTGRIASLMGAVAVETAGTQNYSFAVDQFRDRFKASFDYAF